MIPTKIRLRQKQHDLQILKTYLHNDSYQSLEYVRCNYVN